MSGGGLEQISTSSSGTVEHFENVSQLELSKPGENPKKCQHSL